MRKEYEDSLKAYRDVKNSIDMKTFMQMTDLSKSEIEKLSLS